MPIVDMPLDDLYKYKGITPKPKDFDGFWDNGIKEVKSIPLNLTISKSEFQARNSECYDLYFDSTFGSRIYAKYIRPKNYNGSLPVVLQFHGYPGNSCDWFDKLAFSGEGYIYLGMDCRGQWGKSTDCCSVKGTTVNGHIIRGLADAPEKMYFRNVFLDTVQLVRVAKALKDVDENRIYCTGGSQGGGLTFACAALNGNDIKRAAAAFPFLSDYKRTYEMDLYKDAYAELNFYIRNYAYDLKSKDAFFEKLGYIDIHNLAPRISAELYMATGLMDTVCPPSTQFAAYNAVTSKKKVDIYTNHGHEWLPDINDRFLAFFNA